MKTLFLGFIFGDDGQDIIEYALLSATIGLSAAVVFDLIAEGIAFAYSSWDGTTQGLWEPEDPLQ